MTADICPFNRYHSDFLSVLFCAFNFLCTLFSLVVVLLKFYRVCLNMCLISFSTSLHEGIVVVNLQIYIIINCIQNFKLIDIIFQLCEEIILLFCCLLAVSNLVFSLSLISVQVICLFSLITCRIFSLQDLFLCVVSFYLSCLGPVFLECKNVGQPPCQLLLTILFYSEKKIFDYKKIPFNLS